MPLKHRAHVTGTILQGSEAGIHIDPVKWVWPMFFGVLAQVYADMEPHAEDSFVIISAVSDSGMIDIHDRKPLVLSREHANEWLDPSLSNSRAEETAESCCRPTEELEWFPVGREVGMCAIRDRN